MTPFRLYAEGIVRKIRDSLSNQLPTSGDPKLRPLRIWGDEWGQ